MANPPQKKTHTHQGSLHYTPEHCVVNGGFQLYFGVKSHMFQMVSHNRDLLRSPAHLRAIFRCKASVLRLWASWQERRRAARSFGSRAGGRQWRPQMAVAQNSRARVTRCESSAPFTKVSFWYIYLSHSQMVLFPKNGRCTTTICDFTPKSCGFTSIRCPKQAAKGTLVRAHTYTQEHRRTYLLCVLLEIGQGFPWRFAKSTGPM